MSILTCRRRKAGKREAAGLLVELVGKNMRADNFANGQIQTASYPNWILLKLTFANYLTGALTFSPGGTTIDNVARWIFVRDDSLCNRPVVSSNPRTITPSAEPNIVFASVRIFTKDSAYLKDSNGNFLWNGATEDWDKLGV